MKSQVILAGLVMAYGIIRSSNDFGRFFKATIDDILEFMKTHNN